ncbi:Aste57867_12076 [Aphanomyces stellatus]|uniref:Carboxypeptidase n=1 Tax=Aphanomyces stellatus TaxID=120398 RepID=A0A485KUL8_9STRA|nr:hypothetical protein As57867_012031 [Aphanomyces stellatus]VFT88931.1 Aste57867_12076 [Aphanomyces stellatus]
MRRLLLLLAAAQAAYAMATAPPNPHKITSLPHYGDTRAITFDQYAGHLALPSTGQKMFYWLTESDSGTSMADPLVLWLNGGPGCSSLGGLFTELGPFVVESDLTVKRNPYAWNRNANILFLESPAGVGFSQPMQNASSYNDDTTTDRAYEFLQQFLAQYPQYHNREFYIAGESYAGMYIPYLVHKLVTQPLVNLTLTGFAIGNPFTDNVVDGMNAQMFWFPHVMGFTLASAYMDYMYTHGLISIEMYDLGNELCGADGVAHCIYGAGVCPEACLDVLLKDFTSSEWTNPHAMDPSYIYGDVCKLRDNQARMLTSHNIRPLTHRGEVGPCQDRFATLYLQLYAVQKALHVEDGHVNWSVCNNHVAALYRRTRSALPKYPIILQAGLKALIYSGDADSTVNFLGTERWLTTDGLNLTVHEKWQAWFGPDKQLAGYATHYTNVTFKTVKGAGHMVPATRPLHALYMIECFLFGTQVCTRLAYPKDDVEYLSGADTTILVETDKPDDALIPWAITAVVVVIGSIVGLVFWAKKEERQRTTHQYVELSSADSRSTYF